MAALDRIAAAATSPTFASLEAARGYDPALTEAEYALARVVASEDGPGPAAELACIADATVNHAGGRNLVDHITGGNGFGSQGTGGRPMSSRLPPGPRHLEAAVAVLRRRFLGAFPAPLARIARGATHYFSPSSQDASRDDSHCPPLVILERWTFNKPWADRASCTLGPAGPRSGQLEWVGPIAGVDPWRQMFLRPATFEQGSLYADARQVIESRGAYRGKPRILNPGATILLAGLLGLHLLQRVA